jgi:2-polyprenyl-3-methyl-5-hydroxy-6-metoxy-1,4-benzoquinol methylase
MPDKSLLFDDYSSSVDSDFVSQNNGRVATFSNAISRITAMNTLSSDALIVDIGSASGAFLSAAKKAGLTAIGYEPSKWMVDYGRRVLDVDLRVGDVHSLEKELDQPYVVTLWDVLEHLAEPKNAIDIVTTNLNKEGFVVISLPDSSSLSARLLRSYWPMHLDVHLAYFNEKSLRGIFKRNNFELVEKLTYFQTLSLGYLILRLFRMFKNVESDGRVHNFLLTSRMLRINFSYSVGQKVFVFHRTK